MMIIQDHIIKSESYMIYIIMFNHYKQHSYNHNHYELYMYICIHIHVYMYDIMYVYKYTYVYTYIYLMSYTVPSLRNFRRYAYETLVKKIRTGQGQKRKSGCSNPDGKSTLTDKAKEIHHIHIYIYMIRVLIYTDY